MSLFGRVFVVTVMGVVAGSFGCDDMRSLPGATTPPTTTVTVSPDAGPPPLTGAQAQQEVMQRWNAAVDATAESIDFHWSSFDQFPHPTYKQGTAQAYQQFAAVLIAFLQGGDNFDFLAKNQLFTMPLQYVFPSGQVGIQTTFEHLPADFSSGSYEAFAQLSDADRQTLMDFSARIETALGH